MSFNLIKLSCAIVAFFSCSAEQITSSSKEGEHGIDTLQNAEELMTEEVTVLPGACQIEAYLPLLQGKKVAVVANQASRVGDAHLVDSLLALGVTIEKIFTPEHGFRGNVDAGAHVNDAVDAKTGLSLVSLYGNNKKPSVEQLKQVDVMLFDLQDVGVRFYTYISTLHYVMEACAALNIPLVLLDRPNPNAHYIDGPVLEEGYTSFVGMHPVPVVYGMSIGEYAQMINGEYWLNDSLNCELKVIPILHWDHQTVYELPIAPSPNLPNQLSIYLYPSLCFFEGTVVSVGRGTDHPFQLFGHPKFADSTFAFTPVSTPGKSLRPPHENVVCFGKSLSSLSLEEVRNMKCLNLNYLIEAYQKTNVNSFFSAPKFFNLLAGNNSLMEQVKRGETAEQIRASWQSDLSEFKKLRAQYLIYP